MPPTTIQSSSPPIPRASVGKTGGVIVPGAILFLLLVFGTSTVFVNELGFLELFQIGVYALVAGCILWYGRRTIKPSISAFSWMIYVIPFWGALQLWLHTTVSTFETRREILKWGALAGVFFVATIVTRSHIVRRIALEVFLGFATLMAILCLTQMFTSGGRVLWMFPTGYPDVYATFPNHNNYAQFAELALPIAIWRFLVQGWKSWWHGVAAGIIYASVVGSASRAGTLLCTAELIALLVIGALTLRSASAGIRPRHLAGALIIVPVLAGAFTVVVGWQEVWKRFKEHDPYFVRSEFIAAAVSMAKNKPLLGHGLGTFPEVYQRFATKDFPFYANHAHCDWAEFAADGGVPFLLLILIPFAYTIPVAVRHPWGIGVVAVMLHAFLDYPFPRPAVSGWLFAMLAALYMARASEPANNRR